MISTAKKGGNHMADCVITVNYKVKPEHIEEFIELLKENAINVLKEPGCLNYEASVDNLDVFLYEKYKAKEDIDFHISTPYYKNYVEKTKDLLDEKVVKKYISL